MELKTLQYWLETPRSRDAKKTSKHCKNWSNGHGSRENYQAMCIPVRRVATQLHEHDKHPSAANLQNKKISILILQRRQWLFVSWSDSVVRRIRATKLRASSEWRCSQTRSLVSLVRLCSCVLDVVLVIGISIPARNVAEARRAWTDGRDGALELNVAAILGVECILWGSQGSTCSRTTMCVYAIRAGSWFPLRQSQALSAYCDMRMAWNRQWAAVRNILANQITGRAPGLKIIKWIQRFIIAQVYGIKLMICFIFRCHKIVIAVSSKLSSHHQGINWRFRFAAVNALSTWACFLTIKVGGRPARPGTKRDARISLRYPRCLRGCCSNEFSRESWHGTYYSRYFIRP